MNATKTITDIITYFSAFISLLPVINGVLCFKNLNHFLIPIFTLTTLSFVVEIVNGIVAELGRTNLFIYHIFTVVEFTLITVFFALFFKKYFSPLIIYSLIPAFLIIAYIDYNINGLGSMDNFSAASESIILIFFALFFFYYVLKNLIFENLFSAPIFWINTGILFYFSGNMILFVFSNYVAKNNPQNYIMLWLVIHTFFNVLYNIFLSIGFWKTKEK